MKVDISGNFGFFRQYTIEKHGRLKSYCRTKREFAVATRNLLHTDTFRSAVIQLQFLFERVAIAWTFEVLLPYQTGIFGRNKEFTAHKDVPFCGNTIAVSF